MRSTNEVLQNIGILGLNWRKILGVDSYRFERNPDWEHYSLRNSKYRSATLGMIRFLLRDLLLFREVLQQSGNHCSRGAGYLFFKSLNRRDYNAFFNAVAEQAQSACVVKMETVGRTQSVNWYATWLFFRHGLVFFELMKHWGSYKSLYFYSKIVRYLCVLRKVKTNQPKVVVVFADMHPLDNLIAQYFGRNGAITATLQHGLYVDYGSLHTVNSLNYSNVVSQYFFSWGANTASIIERHNPQVKVLICGKPTLSGELQARSNSGFFTVLFDQKMYAEQNQQLLRIAEEIAYQSNLKVALKLHPTTPRDQYQFDPALEMPVDAAWENSRFCLGHSTSMIYEMLRRGMKVFKLKSEVPGHPLPEDFSFSSASDLMAKLDRALNPVEVGRAFVKYTGSESSERYRKALESL